MHKTFVVSLSFILFLTGLVIGNAMAGDEGLPGFDVSEIRFDESRGNKWQTPMIPKDWRLVGVSNGEEHNANILWFQDHVGNVYLVSGFTSGGKFTLLNSIGKISVRN
jgi:hypothetical protein